MIKVSFFTEDKIISGFEFNGHSGYSEEGSDIVCASVSSATYMAANTITDVIGLKADIDVNDAFMSFHLHSDLSQAQQILLGLRLHLESLAQDYPNNIKVTSVRRCQNA